MTDLLIATHDQAVAAIIERTSQPGTDRLVVDVLAGILEIHRAEASDTNRPNPDCGSCEGAGWIEYAEFEDGPTVREHCHCRCPWCVGCEEPLCVGPCPTVEAIAVALGLLPDLPVMPCGAFQPAQPPAMAYRCSAPHDHLGEHVATIDGADVARWAASTNLPEGEARA